MLSDKIIEYFMKKFFFVIFAPMMLFSSGVWIFLLLHYDRKSGENNVTPQTSINLKNLTPHVENPVEYSIFTPRPEATKSQPYIISKTPPKNPKNAPKSGIDSSIDYAWNIAITKDESRPSYKENRI